jgi:hypothetical protein
MLARTNEVIFAIRAVMLRRMSPLVAVRPEGANHQWRKNLKRHSSAVTLTCQ